MQKADYFYDISIQVLSLRVLNLKQNFTCHFLRLDISIFQALTFQNLILLILKLQTCTILIRNELIRNQSHFNYQLFFPIF
jgi:hypothetical protein